MRVRHLRAGLGLETRIVKKAVPSSELKPCARRPGAALADLEGQARQLLARTGDWRVKEILAALRARRKMEISKERHENTN